MHLKRFCPKNVYLKNREEIMSELGIIHWQFQLSHYTLLWRMKRKICKTGYKNSTKEKEDTDASYKVVSEFLEKDSRIEIYRKDNGGLSDARSFGLKHVKGCRHGFIRYFKPT